MAEQAKEKKPLGHLLRDRGLITEDQLEKALEEARTTGEDLGAVMVNLRIISEKDILKALGLDSKVEKVDLTRMEIPPEVIKKISPAIARIYEVVPIKFERNALTIAMADSLNVSTLDDLRFTLGIPVKGAVAAKEDIAGTIAKLYGVEEETVSELLREIEEELPTKKIGEEEMDVDTLQEMASGAPVVKLLNLILTQAIKDRASDIHFEPFDEEYKVRYRVDGALYEMVSPPKELSLPISSRIKVMAGLDIAERRLPQDGRILFSLGRKKVDLRVSTLPTVFGESVVMRVLDKSVVSLSLDQIGFPADTLRKVRELVAKPNGIILVTGPTGCGKTTTLYSCLREINKIDYKIITTEEPVEYDIPGIMQVNINSKLGLDFSLCLRHILRQDPDIILVGEIRDVETAQMAIQASLTGHLVFSTLHTNDAPGAITRMTDMGIEPFLITSTLEAVFAQRLVRTICPNCKEEYEPDEAALKELSLTSEDIKGKKLFYGRGCRECNNTGYRGRMAICELLILNDEVRSAVLKRTPTAEIREIARKHGMRMLREDGLLRIYDGLTTIEEVVRATQIYL